MSNTLETIYLIQGEYDGERGLVWCDDPAPDDHCDPAEAVKYVRADVHQAIIDRQAKAALMGMDAAKHHALSAEQNARRLLAESNPEAIESERAANAQLTQELEQLRTRVAELADRNETLQLDTEEMAAFVYGGGVKGYKTAECYLLRKQAEAMEALQNAIKEQYPLEPFGDLDEYAIAGTKEVYTFIETETQRLRNEAERVEDKNV